MKKKPFILYYLILFMLLTTTNSWGFNKKDIPTMIKIGIRYENKAASVVNLYSASGFQFGYYDEGIFDSIFYLPHNRNIIIRKDGYYIKFNGAYLESNPEEERSIKGNQLYGPYHVQIVTEFNTRDEMENFLNSLDDDDFYPVYEDGWQIWTGLFTSKEEAEEFIENKGKIHDKNLKVVNPNNYRVQVMDDNGDVLFIYNSTQGEYSFRPVPEKGNDGVVNLDGKNFRGGIIIKRYSDSDMTVINHLSLREYLYGVLPKEMSGDWPLEALKAQAVAARNYAVANIGKHNNYGFDLCDTIDCQVYGGYDVEKPRSNRAVDETAGKVLTYNGRIVSAFFHSNSGGHTEDSENIWNLSIPYIRGVKDDFSLGAPNSSWTQVYSVYEIEDVLSSKGFDVGNIYEIYPEKYSENGRVLSLKIKGSSDEISLPKEKTRALFGYNEIKSMWFNVRTDADLYIRSAEDDNMTNKPLNRIYITKGSKVVKAPERKTYKIYNGEEYVSMSGIPAKYIFEGRGWGHGLGMSQWGAKKMAEMGYTYEDILKHYYTGTTLE